MNNPDRGGGVLNIMIIIEGKGTGSLSSNPG